jgi:hypothetical protein
MTAGVVFLARLSPAAPAGALGAVERRAARLAAEGWTVDPHAAPGRPGAGRARCYRASAFQAHDVFGVFEAPGLEAAHRGISALCEDGWGRLFDETMWLVGPRDMFPVAGAGPHAGAVGFLALWDWNDAWHAADPEERRVYDADCDVAFHFDVDLGIDLFGRFRTSGESGWDHAALWECPDLSALTRAMGAHEAQRDFMFTTSSHFVGRACVFGDLRRWVR